MTYSSIAHAFCNGEGVAKDEEMAKRYWEQAALGGHVTALYNLGIKEEFVGNMSRSIKHYTIAVGFGDVES